MRPQLEGGDGDWGVDVDWWRLAALSQVRAATGRNANGPADSAARFR